MAIDLTGGLAASADLLVARPPEQRDMRESVSMWISDDAGRFGFPRIALEAIASQWQTRGIQANIAFPDGRVLIGSCAGNAHDVMDSTGRPSVFGAGPLRFQCAEPFQRWTMSFHGTAQETTVAQQVRGTSASVSRHVEIEMEAVMAVPPWVQGEMSSEGRTLLQSGVEGLFMGGERYEQLFRAQGSFRIEGEKELTFTGTGLRIHRVGVRDVSEFWGHCWQSALFPSGKAFGYVAYPPRPDGSASYSEGFLFDGAKMMPAKVIEAPWMTKFIPSGGPVDLILETVEGRTRISGVTHDSTFTPPGRPMFGNWQVQGCEAAMAIPFHQGGARYQWGDEVAYGMVERSYPPEKVKI